MPKYQALCDSFGFQGRYFEKDEIVESDVKPPKHFKLIGDEPILPQAQAQAPEEANTFLAVAREELLLEARSRNIKDAEILTQDELLEVLARDVNPNRIWSIRMAAKRRQKKLEGAK